MPKYKKIINGKTKLYKIKTMLKKVSLLLSLVAVFMLSSCNSKMKEMAQDNFTVTPSVLEVVGSEIPVTIDGKFPAKYFNNKSVMTVTPVLKYEGGEAVAESSTFQGEKVLGNDQTISYKEGGNFKMKMTFDYVPAMEKAELYVRFTVNKGKKTYTIPEVKIADGCVATAQLYRQTAATANTAYGDDAFQRIIKQAKEANIMFLIQQANLRSSELKSDNINDLKATLKEIANDVEGKALENVEISAYASPDGELKLNDGLANNRGNNTAKFINKEMKRAKIEGNVDNMYTAEDWAGFQELVSMSELPDKELILRVLSMYNDPEEREAQIKNISSVYSELAKEILPKLRRARITLNYQLIGRSDDQIKEQYAADAKVLSLEELLYAAILTNDVKEKEDIFKTAVSIYPNDYRAYNNLGVLAYNKGDYAAAANYFAQAEKVDANAAEVKVNLGYMQLMNGNLAEAEAYMTKGTAAKVSNEALGNLYIAQGQYGRAASMLAGTNTNGAALAQILNNDYRSANKTLAAISTPDALTYYIKALLGARTANNEMVYEGLKNAVKLDPAMAGKAAADLEFRKYAQDEKFQSIVK